MTPLLAEQLRADRSFERIYRKHVGDVYRYALAVLRQPADAEDVAQTTFLNAYRAYQRGERPRNAQNWLITITHNVCRQRFRQAQRRPDEVEFDDRVGEVVPEEDRGPSARDIQRALGHLAFNQRAVLVMRELEGRSYAEIAEILETSVSAVETLLFRARRALREQLEGALTCEDAERAISRQTDGRLSRSERSSLRAHLRQCRECERLARSQRAHKKAYKALALVPVPTSLTSLFGSGGAVVGGAAALKAAAFVGAGVVATGVGYQGARELTQPSQRKTVVTATTAAAQRPAAPLVAHLRTPATKPLAKQKEKTRETKGRAPGRVGRSAKPSPPGQAGKQTTPAVNARAIPPGQVKKAERRTPKQKPVPPERVKKAEPRQEKARGRP